MYILELSSSGDTTAQISVNEFAVPVELLAEDESTPTETDDTPDAPDTPDTPDHLPGDINDDGKVNMKDLTRLHQYVNGWDVIVKETALDVNGDGKINMKDVTRLHQHINGWDVEIS